VQTWQGCVPRICHLRITKIEALTQLTSSKSEIKIVVVMNDGRSRLRDGVRMARLKRAALSSAPMPVQMTSSCSIAVNIDFYMQYFHNLRQHTDTFRILLQKKSKRSLVNKVIAECTVVLADVLQGPLDEGSHLMLHSTGRLKHSQQTGAINTPLIRIHAQLESLALDSSDLTKWWPSDKGDDGDDGHTPNLDGVFSAEEIEEEEDDENDYPDNDEWVETHQVLSDANQEEAEADDGELGYDAIQSAPGGLQSDGIGINGIGINGIGITVDARRGANFRAKVLSGTRKIANLTLHPLRAVKSGYARIRSRRGKGIVVGSHGPQGPGGEPLDDAADGDFSSLFGGDLDDDDGLQQMAWDDDEYDDNADEDDTTPTTPTGTSPPEIAAQVAEILRTSAQKHERHGAMVLLLNTASRRGALLHDWLTLDDENLSLSWDEQAPLGSSLHTSVVAAPGVKDIRAALRSVMSYWQHLDRLEDGAHVPVPIRVAILGGDLYTHTIVREWVRIRQHAGANTYKETSASSTGHAACTASSEGVRFFLVPLGANGRESNLSVQLGARDAQYCALFLSDQWIDLWHSFAESTMPDSVGAQIEDYITRYLQVRACV